MLLPEYKIVVLGSGGVGKSALSVRSVENVFIPSYDPTIEDSYRKLVKINDKQCTLEILDTAGVGQFAAMIELYIKSGQGFLLVFDLTDPQSMVDLTPIFNQIKTMKAQQPNVPIILAGNKCDLTASRQITNQEVDKIARCWQVPYFETSALTGINVNNVFLELGKLIVQSIDGEIDSLHTTTINKSLTGGEFQGKENNNNKEMDDTSTRKRTSRSAACGCLIA